MQKVTVTWRPEHTKTQWDYKYYGEPKVHYYEDAEGTLKFCKPKIREMQRYEDTTKKFLTFGHLHHLEFDQF